MVGIPSREATASKREATASKREASPGSACESTSMMAVESIDVRSAADTTSGGHPLLVDFLLELDDTVDERFGPRRTAGHEHVHRHHLVDTLHNGVVVEHAPDRGAGTHR